MKKQEEEKLRELRVKREVKILESEREREGRRVRKNRPRPARELSIIHLLSTNT